MIEVKAYKKVCHFWTILYTADDIDQSSAVTESRDNVIS